jgi:hypothetical protein
MSDEEDELEQVRIPTEIVQEIVFQANYEKRKPIWIAEHLKKQGFPYSKDEVQGILKYFKKVRASEKKLYRIEQYAEKRKRERLQGRRYGEGSGFGSSPRLIRESLTIKRDEKRRSKQDVIRIITDLGCYYCKKAKQEGAYQDQIKKMKKKFGKKFYIYDIEVLTNPVFSVIDKSLRVDLQYHITNLGLIPPFFNLYIPCLYIQSPTHEIPAQWRRGVDPYHLYDAIEFIIEHKPDPEPFFSLPSHMHTGSYVSKVSLGVNLKYIKAEKGAIL